MDLSKDPRITDQMDYLMDVPLRHRRWFQPQENWDHDHCEFCWKTLDASTEEPAYCTEDCDSWICPDCYNDFKEAFGWTLLEGEGGTDGQADEPSH